LLNLREFNKILAPFVLIKAVKVWSAERLTQYALQTDGLPLTSHSNEVTQQNSSSLLTLSYYMSSDIRGILPSCILWRHRSLLTGFTDNICSKHERYREKLRKYVWEKKSNAEDTVRQYTIKACWKVPGNHAWTTWQRAAEEQWSRRRL